jgi:hypothetical protein
VTRVGVRGGAAATVDRAGRIDLAPGKGAIDWWVGADDRWHRPGVETAVRQKRLEDGPVVETWLRLPGGDAVQRVFGARLPATTGSADHLVVEVENRSRLPVVVALTVGPSALVSQDGRLTSSAAGPVLVAPRGPSRLAVATGEDELFSLVAAGGAVEGERAELVDRGGRAGLAALWPLPHTATIRFLVPLAEPPVGRPVPDGPVGTAAVVPTAEQVARGWRRQIEHDVRVEVPDATVAAAVTAARSELLLVAGGGGVDALDPAAALAVVRAATRWGHDDVIADGLTGLAVAAAAPRGSGWSGGVGLPVEGEPEDATAALLSALADAWRLGLADPVFRWLRGEVPVAGEEPVGRSGHVEEVDGLWPADAPGGREVPRAAEDTTGGTTADLADRVIPLVGAAVARLDAALRRRRPGADRLARYLGALDDAAELFEAAGQPAAAEDVRRIGGRRRSRGPFWRGDRAGGDEGRPPPPSAMAPAAAGDWEDVRRWVGVASPTWTWTAPATGPRLLVAVRAVLLDDPPDGSLALAPGWPSAWWGAPVSVIRLASRRGPVSWALRWHGDRPALLWEVEAPGAAAGRFDPPVLSAPALDPAWRGRGWRGEALLGPVPAPSTPEGHELDGSTSFG